MSDNFDKYIKDRTFLFYGVDNNKFKLGKDVWEAIEDPDDGYRSHLDTIREVILPKDIFFKRPIAKVFIKKTNETNIEDYYDFTGYIFIDVEDNHGWLIVGTADVDDYFYFPCFIFDYRPKKKIEPLDLKPKIKNDNNPFEVETKKRKIRRI